MLVLDGEEAVLDGDLDRGRRRHVLVAGRVLGVRGGEPAGLALERRGEEERLAVQRGLLDDAVDRGLEAHVEHAVGLVEDQHLDVAQADVPALDEVLEAAGRRDDDVRLRGDARLLLDADAAVDGADAEGAGVGQRLDSSSTIWLASSRVGARTSAAGRRSVASTRSTTGMPKASVLPDPVGDLARTSRPASTSAMTSSWIAKGVVKPRSDSAEQTTADAPRSANDLVMRIRFLRPSSAAWGREANSYDDQATSRGDGAASGHQGSTVAARRRSTGRQAAAAAKRRASSRRIVITNRSSST